MRTAVIGAGPAGLFCAYELARNGIEVVVFERGSALENRVCPDRDCTRCAYESSCAILCGEAGAGGYSDGKVTLSTTRGVQVNDELNFAKFSKEIEDVDIICQHFNEIGSAFYNPVERPAFLESSPFKFESYPLRFYGTTGIRQLMHAIRTEAEKYGATFLFNTLVEEIYYLRTADPVVVVAGIDRGAQTSDFFDNVIIASGSIDRTFMKQLALANGVALSEDGYAGFGIRLEAQDGYLERMMSEFYDYKLYLEMPFQGANIQLRSFCVNRSGSIVNENRPNTGIVSINGRSEAAPTGRSNLAIMASIPFGKQIVRTLAASVNDIGLGLPVYQPAVEFIRYSDNHPYEKWPVNHKVVRRNAARANLASILPDELLAAFQTYLAELERIMPGCVTSNDALVYAPEIKYHMPRWPLVEGFVVKGVPAIQIIGNAAGYTDSISTAAVMGLVAARYRISQVYDK